MLSINGFTSAVDSIIIITSQVMAAGREDTSIDQINLCGLSSGLSTWLLMSNDHELQHVTN